MKRFLGAFLFAAVFLSINAALVLDEDPCDVAQPETPVQRLVKLEKEFQELKRSGFCEVYSMPGSDQEDLNWESGYSQTDRAQKVREEIFNILSELRILNNPKEIKGKDFYFEGNLFPFIHPSAQKIEIQRELGASQATHLNFPF